MAVCGLSLHQGSMESHKTLEGKYEKISLQWPIYIINPVDAARSTPISLESYPLYIFVHRLTGRVRVFPSYMYVQQGQVFRSATQITFDRTK